MTEELAFRGFEYAAAPEARDIVRIEDGYGLFVGGEWRTPAETYATISPASEEPLAEVGQASGEDVDAADAARAAATAASTSSPLACPTSASGSSLAGEIVA